MISALAFRIAICFFILTNRFRSLLFRASTTLLLNMTEGFCPVASSLLLLGLVLFLVKSQVISWLFPCWLCVLSIYLLRVFFQYLVFGSSALALDQRLQYLLFCCLYFQRLLLCFNALNTCSDFSSLERRSPSLLTRKKNSITLTFTPLIHWIRCFPGSRTAKLPVCVFSSAGVSASRCCTSRRMSCRESCGIICLLGPSPVSYWFLGWAIVIYSFFKIWMCG